jgi:hypothetical protein
MKWKTRDWSFDMISGREMVNSNDEETSDKVKFFWRSISNLTHG